MGRSSIVLPASASDDDFDFNDAVAAASSKATVELEASQTRETPALESDDMAFVRSLYAACAHGDDNDDDDDGNNGNKLMEDELAANLGNMHPRLVVALQLAAEEGTWKKKKKEDDEFDDDEFDDDDDDEFEKQMVSVGLALKSVLDVRLRSGRELLAKLLDSGELRKMDGAIGKAAKDGKLDMSFFSVLGMNMRDATFKGGDVNVVSLEPTLATGEGQEEVVGPQGRPNASASRLQILQHIYTRCQEELEKNVPPGVGLLNKLLRTEIPSIRSNQLGYYLGPQATSITSPDGKTTIDLVGSTARPLVSHEEFVGALANAVDRIRTLEGAGGTDRLSAMNLLESIRRVAVEARAVLAESYGEDSDAVREFQDDLQPVFWPPSS